MAPDRSRIHRSPILPKKSPCQVVPRQEGGGFARKCSSPVFTSSPSRPPDVRTRRLQAPDHHHQKENGHCGIARPPPSSPAAAARFHRSVLPEKPEASPKKILGENNVDAVLPSKKSRKEWQIPSPSTLELKKSSVESPVETVADQAPSFPVNLEVLGEPLPVAGWVQERVSHRNGEESKSLSRNLFRDLSESTGDRSARQSSSEWSASDRVVFEEAASAGKITLEKKGMDGNREDSLGDVTSAAISSQLSSSIVSAKLEIHGTPEVTSVATENQPKEDIRDSVPGELPETISEVEAPLEFANAVFSKAQEVDESSDSSMRRWALGFLVLVALTLTLIVSRRQHFSELWRRQSESFLVAPSFMEWSSETDTVGLYCDPELLLKDLARMKLQLAQLYEKWSGNVVEQLGLSSVRLVSSYYSSLVLGNHAKDILFDYCHEFQGQYYRVRLAAASLIEQAIPLEAAARDVLQNWSFENFLSGITQWFSSAESYVNGALVYSYLRLPPSTPTVEEAKESPKIESSIGLEVPEVAPDPERFEVAQVETAAENQFSYATGWIGDSISLCEAPRPRSRENLPPAERVAETNFPPEVRITLKTGNLSAYNLYLGVALASAILGAAVAHRIRSFSKAPQEKPQQLELSSQDIMRMRGADEELVLSPQQEGGSYSPYGSFTAYKRVVYNEGSENEHVRLTPVRRSSRIRNHVSRGFNS